MKSIALRIEKLLHPWRSMPAADGVVLSASRSDVEIVMARTLANTSALLHNRACVDRLLVGYW
jgi:hypothetical protein